MDETIDLRLKPARRDSGLKMPGKYVWCSSVIEVEGTWNMFSSVWPEREAPKQHDKIQLLQNYWRLSTIVRAEADDPEGPYEFRELVLEGQGEGHWAYECCHNPCIVKVNDRFVLYFQTKGVEHDDRKIGYATTTSIHGPWKLANAPIDLGHNVTNPSVWVEEDDSIRMVFRTPGMKLAVAEADCYDGEYRIVNRDICPGIALEDPFLYKLESTYHLLVEDNEGRLTGTVRHGGHLVSNDGVNFEPHFHEQMAYTHTIDWQDGTTERVARRERPWLILQGGQPTHLVTAVLVGTEAFSTVQPLAPSPEDRKNRIKALAPLSAYPDSDIGNAWRLYTLCPDADELGKMTDRELGKKLEQVSFQVNDEEADYNNKQWCARSPFDRKYYRFWNPQVPTSGWVPPSHHVTDNPPDWFVE